MPVHNIFRHRPSTEPANRRRKEAEKDQKSIAGLYLEAFTGGRITSGGDLLRSLRGGAGRVVQGVQRVAAQGFEDIGEAALLEAESQRGLAARFEQLPEKLAGGAIGTAMFAGVSRGRRISRDPTLGPRLGRNVRAGEEVLLAPGRAGSRELDRILSRAPADLARAIYQLQDQFDAVLPTMVTGPGGSPIVVFHGSATGFKEFDSAFVDPEALFGPGGYFTEDPRVANGYAQTRQPRRGRRAPNVRAALLKIRSPLDMDTLTPDFIKEMGESAPDVLIKLTDDLTNSPQYEKAILEARNKGLSGIDEIMIRIEDYVSGIGVRILPSVQDQFSFFQIMGVKNEDLYHYLATKQDTVAGTGGREIVNKWLLTQGYDGITHIGGGRTGGTRHRVWIVLGDLTDVSPRDLIEEETPEAVAALKERSGDLFRAPITRGSRGGVIIPKSSGPLAQQRLIAKFGAHVRNQEARKRAGLAGAAPGTALAGEVGRQAPQPRELWPGHPLYSPPGAMGEPAEKPPLPTAVAVRIPPEGARREEETRQYLQKLGERMGELGVGTGEALPPGAEERKYFEERLPPGVQFAFETIAGTAVPAPGEMPSTLDVVAASVGLITLPALLPYRVGSRLIAPAVRHVQGPAVKLAMVPIKAWRARKLRQDQVEALRVLDEQMTYVQGRGQEQRAIDGFVAQLEKLPPVRRKLTRAQRKERGVRFKRGEEVLKAVRGAPGLSEQEAAQLSMAVQKGELADRTPFVINPWNVNALFKVLNDYQHRAGMPSFATAFNGLNKMLGMGKHAGNPILPAPSELAKLEVVFGAEFGRAVRGLNPSRWKEALDLLGIPKVIQTAYDLSALARQGGLMSMAHPTVAARTIPKYLFKSFFSERHAQAYDGALRAHPDFAEMRHYGLEITSFNRKSGVGEAEEAFVSRWFSSLPGIKQSQRAYVSYLNKLRFDIMKNQVNAWKSHGLGPSDVAARAREYAKFVNWTTGRGPMPRFGRGDVAASLLNFGAYSPRYFTSIPATWASPFILGGNPASKNGMVVRGMIAKDLLSAFGGGTTTLWLLDKVPGVDIEINPLSSDFGKIRVGKLRVNIWGAHQTLFRTMAQMIARRRKLAGAPLDVSKEVAEDFMRDAEATEVLMRFLQGKLAPVPGAAIDIMRGQTFFGEELQVIPAEGDILERVEKSALFQRLAPLVIQDTIEALVEEGKGAALFAGTASFFGLSVQAFETTTQVRDKVARGRYNKPFVELRKGQRAMVDASPEVMEALKVSEGRKGPSEADEYSVVIRRWQEVTDQLEEEVLLTLSGAASDAVKGAAYREFKKRRFIAGDALFGGLSKDRFPEPRLQDDILADRYWSAEAPVDYETGQVLFWKRDETREAILKEARREGIDTDYITGTGPDDYRAGRFTSGALREFAERFENETDTLQTRYFSIREKTARSFGALSALRKYDGISNRRQRENFLQLHSHLARALKRTGAKQRELRRYAPSIDAMLVRWYGDIYTPIR